MSEKKYDVLFTGKLVDGAVEDQVKANVAKLFKTDVAKIQRLFIGMPVMIKKGVDEETALKYMMALKKAGAICEAKEQAASAESAAPPPAAASVPPPQPAAAPSQPASVADASTSAPAHTGKSEAEIAAGEDGDMRFVMKEAPKGLGELESASLEAPGATLGVHEEVAPPQIDTSGLSVDESEKDLVEHEEAPPLEVDVSGMSLSEPGVRIVEETEAPELEVDTSGLTLDEPGVTLVEPEEAEEPDIDTSELKLSGD